MFSLVSTYISWPFLSLPTPRMRKANDSCMVSAAHPLVKRHPYSLLRFSSFHYITKEVVFIGRPPLRSDRREGGVHSQAEVCVSSGKIAAFRLLLRVTRANCSVIGCKNQQCLYYVPATEEQRRQSVCLHDT